MLAPETLSCRRMRARTSEKLDEIFSALAHPVRRAILDQVSESGRSVLELAQPHRMSLNAISKHVKKLEAAGLVTRRVDGSYHRITMEREAMKAALKWMTHYVPFWHENLQNLKATLEKNR